MNASAVFLDKDGTLIEDVPYNVNPDRIRLQEGALESLRLLQDHGYRLIIVSNQSGVARGFFKEKDLSLVEGRLREMIAVAGVSLTGFYYCPHLPGGKMRKYAVDCFCRKPRPGMLYRAAEEHGINLTTSWLVGDILHDVEAGNRAGCHSILINNHHETEWKLTPIRRPEFIVKNLHGAAFAITQEDLLDESMSHANNRTEPIKRN
jgi:D,D-heptose 1,7-bisphosphate phosphatase